LVRIANRVPTNTATPVTSVTLATTSLANSYTTSNQNGNSRLQAITFPTLNTSGGNYTTTANITGLAWNGAVALNTTAATNTGTGGVLAFQVTNTLTLQ